MLFKVDAYLYKDDELTKTEMKIVALTALGGALEFYDFTIYAWGRYSSASKDAFLNRRPPYLLSTKFVSFNTNFTDFFVLQYLKEFFI